MIQFKGYLIENENIWNASCSKRNGRTALRMRWSLPLRQISQSFKQDSPLTRRK